MSLKYWTLRFLNSQKLANIFSHSDIIVGSACFFTFFWLLAVPLGKLLFPEAFHRGCSRDPKFGKKWRDHVVSQLHATIVSLWSLYILLIVPPSEVMSGSEGRLFGYSRPLGRLSSFAIGYFLWDLSVCVFNFSNYGAAFLLHAVICLGCFCLSLTPIMLGYVPIFLMYEGSTVFLNGHWLLEKIGVAKGLMLFNDVLLLISFFGIRLVWGGWWSMRLVADLYWQSQYVPMLSLVFGAIGVICMSVLNNFWFVKIVLSVHRALSKKQPSTSTNTTQKTRIQ